MQASAPVLRCSRPGLGLLAVLLAVPASAQAVPDGARVLGIRAGRVCLDEAVRVTGFALPSEESGAAIPFDNYRITAVLVAEGEAVAAGQEILRAVRQGGEMPGAPRAQRPETFSLRAPIAGRITRLAAWVGMVTGAPSAVPGAPVPASGSLPMVRIASEVGSDLLVDVPSPYAAKLKRGLAARIRTDGGAEIAGSVRVPVAEVDPRTQLGHARIAVEPAGALRHGQFASATFETARRCGVSVPRSAVTHRDGVPTVQVIRGTQVETRRIQTGLADAGVIQVEDGLGDDEAVVADAGRGLRDGERVTPVITGKIGEAR